MSPRDLYWFLGGAVVSLAAAFALRPSPATQPDERVQLPNTAGVTVLDGNDVRAAALITQPGTDAQTTEHGATAPAGGTAGSLDEVTQTLAERLAARGGTDGEWRLLAQSYDYMGMSREAANARAHIASSALARAGGSAASANPATP